MKNSKGFTIPELLSVIIIIGVLAVMAVGTYTGVSNRIKEKTLDQKLNYYKERAYEYANDNIANEGTFTLNQLANLGYIDVDHIENPEYEKIDNPVTGGFLDCMSFTAIKNLTDYDITYNLDSNCDLAINEDRQEEVEVERYIKKDNEYIKIEDEWVNEPVYLFVRLLNYNKYEIADNIISFNGSVRTIDNKVYCDILEDLEDPENSCYNFYKVDTDYIYNNDYIIGMNIIDKLNEEHASYRVTKNIKVKIDKEKPKLKVNYDNAYSNIDFNIDAIGSDGLGSGIMGYYIGKNKLSDDTFFSESNSIKTNGNGTYYAYVKDNAGNISDEVVININNIDRTGPTPISLPPESNWTSSDYTFTFGCSADSKTGCANRVYYKIVNGDTGAIIAEKEDFSASKVTYTVHVDDDKYLEKIKLSYKIYDNVGNMYEENDKIIKVKIDKIVPELTIDHSSYDRKGGLFNFKNIGKDYDLTIRVTKQGPSGISKYGFSTSKTDPDDLNGSTNEELDNYFTNSRTYHTYVAKGSSITVAARAVAGSSSRAYGLIGLNGYGCTNYFGWSAAGSIIGTLILPGLSIWGGIIGWALCNSN